MLSPDNLEVVMVSLEGPDQYSLAGGLGVRARELCRALAGLGFATTLIFAGDPTRAADERDQGVRLLRWGREISSRNPAGVYQGEEEQAVHLGVSLPRFLADEVVGPAAAAGRLVALLAEEWHTAAACNAISDELWRRGLRGHCAILWNANNLYGFERINWGALSYVAAITTVSRYMKHLMWSWGVNPLVIPNGIPAAALDPADPGAVAAIRAAAGGDLLAFKIGRFTPDKRWLQAVDAIAELRGSGVAARLLIRGGIEPHGGEVLDRARARGLEVHPWTRPVAGPQGVADALRGSDGAAVVDLRAFLPDSVIPVIYAAADAVLANSGHEPFGLVGLEAMAAGGVALVGATGEEYARPWANAVVVETEDGVEVASSLRGLLERPALAARLRQAARRDAAELTWERVIEGLVERLRFVCEHQGVAIPG